MAIFTEDYIENLEPAEEIEGFPEKQSDFYDGFNVGPGGRLGIRVRLYDDVKDWFLEYHFRGTIRHLALGQYPGISLEQARKLAAARLSEVD